MPSKRSSQSNKRAQGGGRTANSEPRLQVFKDFNGINFEHASAIWDGVDIDSAREDGDQTNLQMNFMFLQNNVSIESNKTFKTRDDLVTLFDAPDDASFTGPVCLINQKLYAAKSDNKLGVGDLDERHEADAPVEMSDNLILKSWSGLEDDDDYYIGAHIWTSFEHYDDKLIAMTKNVEGSGHRDTNDEWIWDVLPSGGTWTGDVTSSGVTEMSRPQPLLDPETDFNGHLTGMGTLVVSDTSTTECPFRVTIAHTYVNMFGPTKMSPVTVFYVNHPVSEWHAGCYLHIGGIDAEYHPGLLAAELYYATDNAMSMLFLDRVDLSELEPDQEGQAWSYDWYGYVESTSMWTVGNLVEPTENYTAGTRATRICDIDGRLYFWGDEDEPQRLYIGGNPGNLLSISPGVGGGFVDVEPGTNQRVRHVCKYKTQSGNSIVTMLCDSPNSRKEQRFNLVEDTVSLSNEQNMKSWQAEQVAGAVGCKSYDGAVVCEDGLYSVSRYGLALTTMTMEYNSQIRTNYVSDAIKPVFIDAADMGTRLSKAVILELDGIIYMTLGTESDENHNLDSVLFCYDIDLKAWWTYTLDVDSPILNMFHVDWQGQREGIGIVTANHIYMLPTTDGDDESTSPIHDFLIQSAQLSTQMPQQGWQYLSQLEFHFDWFVGDMTIHVRTIDMFGRKLDIKKTVSETEELYDYVVHMRIDQRLMSYVITMEGCARFRMTHFIAKVYTMSNKIGQVWGFDDSISHRSAGSVHPTFKCYNDIRKALFT